MIKSCSLDFINKKEFDADILLSDERIIYSFGDAITPEILLKLYFKDIYIPKKIDFDKEHAERVRDYALKAGKAIGMLPEQLEQLGHAAYYHDIGKTKFSESDVKKSDFEVWQGEAGQKILTTEMHFPIEIAEVAVLHLKDYNSARFPLVKEDKPTIPYAHIVAIANRYDEIKYKKLSKTDALQKILQLGGEKFNIFVLHKFIKAMRETDG